MSLNTVDISPLGLGLIAILMGTNGMLTLAMNLQVRAVQTRLVLPAHFQECKQTMNANKQCLLLN
jgi:hypothetical protein